MARPVFRFQRWIKSVPAAFHTAMINMVKSIMLNDRWKQIIFSSIIYFSAKWIKTKQLRHWIDPVNFLRLIIFEYLHFLRPFAQMLNCWRLPVETRNCTRFDKAKEICQENRDKREEKDLELNIALNGTRWADFIRHLLQWYSSKLLTIYAQNLWWPILLKFDLIASDMCSKIRVPKIKALFRPEFC